MRQIEDVNDEDLINEVANCGLVGLCLYDQPMDRALANLGFDLFTHDGRSTARTAAASLRWYSDFGFKEWSALNGRLERDRVYLRLTNKEWSKRLAGKTAKEIETLLNGSNQLVRDHSTNPPLDR